MSHNEIAIGVAALALQRSGRLAGAALRQLLDELRADEGAGSLSINEVLERVGVSRPSVNKSVGDAQRDIERGLALGIAPVPMSSDRYPVGLRRIADAPPVLFVRGDMAVLDKLPGVAVAGTRRATPHGLMIAERISQYLSDEGWPIVNELAIGINAAAHAGALKGKSLPIAVLAHGLERAGPAKLRPLADRILEDGGAWVSEHPVGVAATSDSLVACHRIQVGLTCASIFVEGTEKSASAVHAEFCHRDAQTVFAILPEAGSKVSTASALPKMLVDRHGATPIFSRADYPAMLEAVARRAAQLRAVP
ncbi:DNA-processing protein DprA [Variovorax saccharolyticus]|uniref:DNA-processing protein DprA n=1 Tax=Variovorax saccharolyticus TaxID=3053516 RepID=UPI0025789B36|nr:DNA-processing protein DprA [Variovorax sp. J22R187]MDM0016208.1 DNA-processing protein DprA [Variovorax sp. J22R187]